MAQDNRQASIPQKGAQGEEAPKAIRLWDAVLYPGLGTTSTISSEGKAGHRLEWTPRGVRAHVRVSGTKVARLMFPWAAIAYVEESD